jgi:hypothetical protein
MIKSILFFLVITMNLGYPYNEVSAEEEEAWIILSERVTFGACPGTNKICTVGDAGRFCDIIREEDGILKATPYTPLCTAFKTYAESAIGETSLLVGPYIREPDLTGDGVIGLPDFRILGRNFGNPYTLQDFICLSNRFIAGSLIETAPRRLIPNCESLP